MAQPVVPTRPVTQADVVKIQADFNSLVDDIVALVPQSMALTIAIMTLKMAEGAVIPLLTQHMAP